MERNNAIVAALTQLIEQVDAASIYDIEYESLVIRDKADERRLHMRCLSAIDRYAPAGSAYHKQADAMRESPSWAPDLGSILEALRDDYREGGMRSVAELLHAALFDDFLEMATELDSKGFHGPAAVLAGSVLEEHFRKLADKNGAAVGDR